MKKSKTYKPLEKYLLPVAIDKIIFGKKNRVGFIKQTAEKFGFSELFVKYELNLVKERISRRYRRLKKHKKVIELSLMSNIEISELVELIISGRVLFTKDGIKTFEKIILAHNKGIKKKFDCKPKDMIARGL